MSNIEIDFVEMITNTAKQLNAKIQHLEDENNKLKQELEQIKIRQFPIGYVFLTMDERNPETYIGGEWMRLDDGFLLSQNIGGKTGGSRYITQANMPSHTHGSEFRIQNRIDIVHINCEEARNSKKIHINDSEYGTVCATTSTGSVKIVGNVKSSGQGEPYYPEYVSVVAWQRVG